MSFPVENTFSTAAFEGTAAFIFIETRFNASCLKHGKSVNEALTCL